MKNNYWLGKKHSAISIQKMRMAKLGKKMSEETKRRMSESSVGMKGKNHSLETRKKIGEGHKGLNLGSKNAAWKGGVTKHPSYYSFKERRRNLKKIIAGGFHTLDNWHNLKAQYNWTCPCCKRVEPEIKLTEDHIIPISKGGSDNIENIQPLCRSCNSKKHTKIIKYDN